MRDSGRYDVRGDALRVARQARCVAVNGNGIEDWARAVDPAAIVPNSRPAELRFVGTPDEVVAWTLLLDALNFCFWDQGEEPWELEYRGGTWRRYYAMRAGLHRGVSANRDWLTPERWAKADRKDVDALFAGRGQIPMPNERVAAMNEAGRVVLQRFGGRPAALAEEAGFDAVRMAELLAENFGSFRDVSAYNGSTVAFLKRAQIFAADLAEGLAGVGGPAVVGLDRLTAFADYRIPQALRHLRILVLEPDLERRIDAGELISPGCREEVELRACSVHAVEQMVEALQSLRGSRVPAWVVDEYLWQTSHDPQVRVQHHRTVTWFY